MPCNLCLKWKNTVGVFQVDGVVQVDPKVVCARVQRCNPHKMNLFAFNYTDATLTEECVKQAIQTFKVVTVS